MTTNNVYQTTDEQFIEIINTSKNIRQALIRLGLKPAGGNYETIKHRCAKLSLAPPAGSVKPKELENVQKNVRKSQTVETITTACKANLSRASTLKTLGLNPINGHNIRWINSIIQTSNIDISHWIGQAHLRGKTHNWSNKQPIEEFLTVNSIGRSSHLKIRLLKEGILKNECKDCGISTWRGKSLSLHLDHINGIHSDNRLDNLRLLCPNCHSLTETYCGKNKNKRF